MNKTNCSLSKILLVGLKARTSNSNEINPATQKIGPTIQKYISMGGGENIANRKNPGQSFGIYTDYESDMNGMYTYFIGQEVTSFENVPEGFSTLEIPAQNYAKFTTKAGAMPDVCIDAWMSIWAMDEHELGARAFVADFELYDERAINPAETVLDIFIGLKNS